MEAKVKRAGKMGPTRTSAAHGNATGGPDVRPGIDAVQVSQSHRKRMGRPSSVIHGRKELAGSQGSCPTDRQSKSQGNNLTSLRKPQTRIGVLALQGDYEQHANQLDLLGVETRLVRLPADLDEIDGLILPGGESTTMSILMERFGLFEPIRRFGQSKPIYGTCAGMILLAHQINENQSGVRTLDLIDIDVERNGYGRQVYSNEAELSILLGGREVRLKAAFIRAPRITRVGEKVTVLGEYGGSAILVRQGNILASSFHAELEEDTRLLACFLEDFVSHIAPK